MADESKEHGNESPKTVGLNIRLNPVEDSDRPVLANFTRLMVRRAWCSLISDFSSQRRFPHCRDLRSQVGRSLNAYRQPCGSRRSWL